MLQSLTKKVGILAGLLLSPGFIGLPPTLTVYLIGDSTMATKRTQAYPETGWGTPFAHFFDETVTVENHAVNGRSTRTFLEENRWQPIADRLRAGDYVLIQFGHNDEVPTKKSYTPEADFRANLFRFITECRTRRANPVLITPVARRQFDSTGTIQETHKIYSQRVRDVAREAGVPLIDLDRSSQALLQQLGPEPSKRLFLHLAPGEYPNYPEGNADNTHFSELGARKIAELVLADLKTQQPDLAERIVRKK